MTKQEQIKEMAHIMCEHYNKGFCAKGDITEICEDMPYCCYKNDAEALYNAGYGNISEYKAENERLKAENARLTGRLGQVLLAVDTVKEMNAMCDIDDQRKQAVKEFADKVKEEVYPFLQAEMYNKKHFITGDHLSDKLLENQNIGILKAQDILSKWFKVKIDELLKEYE